MLYNVRLFLTFIRNGSTIGEWEDYCMQVHGMIPNLIILIESGSHLFTQSELEYLKLYTL